MKRFAARYSRELRNRDINLDFAKRSALSPRQTKRETEGEILHLHRLREPLRTIIREPKRFFSGTSRDSISGARFCRLFSQAGTYLHDRAHNVREGRPRVSVARRTGSLRLPQAPNPFSPNLTAPCYSPSTRFRPPTFRSIMMLRVDCEPSSRSRDL